MPLKANTAAPLTLQQLRSDIARIPGVAAADGLYFVDLPPGALHTRRSTLDTRVRLFAFDASYQSHYPEIRLAAGSLGRSSAVLSAEAARTLSAGVGATVTLTLPGDRQPVSLPVSGVADLAGATPLFSSRKSRKLEDFLYVPNSVVVSPATFERAMMPAFRAASASEENLIKSLPVLEIDVLVDRSRLHADPARALAQTTAIAQSINRLAPGQDYLIDNISNTLGVAQEDAKVGKRLFVFLGLPGALLAAFLAAYAGGILAGTQRRDRATLRLRGADRRHLVQVLSYQTLALAVAGSVLGTALGFLSVIAILGRSSLLAAAGVELVASGLLAVAVGTLCTGLALYVVGHRSLHREISQERRELALDPRPAWRRFGLDLSLLAAGAIAAAIAFRAGSFDGRPASVSAGQSARLPSHLLLAPLLAWVGGTLLLVRAFQGITAHLPLPAPPRFGPAVKGTLSRSIRRRSSALGTGVAGVGLIVAFGLNLAVFSSTYDAAKRSDARFVVGSDVRITPSVLSAEPLRRAFASTLHAPGLVGIAPVVAELENAVLIGPFDQNRADLTAIDPTSFEKVAPLSDSFFVRQSASAAIAALAADRQGLLVNAQTADDLSIETGDEVQVLLARGTDRQILEPFHVVGLFERLPGFPQGVDLVANLTYYESTTGLDQPDFFLARATDASSAGVARASAAFQSGPGKTDSIHIDTTTTALDKDQSSLTALDLHGLLRLDTLYTLLMSGACIGMFVFGLLLHRRREYVILRAHGMSSRQLRRLVLAETGVVAVAGVAAGILVGLGTAYLFVHVLRALFVLEPTVTFVPGRLAVIAALPIVAALASALVATAVLNRLRPTELLRDTTA